MGSKTNPGKFDCYGKAADDEPIFTFRAKDPTAPELIDAWRHIRAGNLKDAIRAVMRADDAWILSGRPDLPLDNEKSIEAGEVATSMTRWARQNRDKQTRS